MILSTAARAAYSKAIALDTAIDARVIRADGTVTESTPEEFEALKDAAEWAWADYREAKDAQVADEQDLDEAMAEEFPTGTAVILSAAVGEPEYSDLAEKAIEEEQECTHRTS